MEFQEQDSWHFLWRLHYIDGAGCWNWDDYGWVTAGGGDRESSPPCRKVLHIYHWGKLDYWIGEWWCLQVYRMWSFVLYGQPCWRWMQMQRRQWRQWLQQRQWLQRWQVGPIVMSGEEEDGIPWFEVKVPPTKLSFSQNILLFIHVQIHVQAILYIQFCYSM